MADVRKAEAELPPDLEAIRARNEERRTIVERTDDEEDKLRGLGNRDDDFDREFTNVHDQRGNPKCSADVDALLAEVERLRQVLIVAMPDAIDRMFIDAVPGAVERYLARCPYCRQDHPIEEYGLTEGFKLTICPNTADGVVVMIPR